MTVDRDSRFVEWWTIVEHEVVSLGEAMLGSNDAARDLSQDIALAALTAFQKNPHGFSDEGHFRAWCRRRARWLAIDRMRFAARRTASSEVAWIAGAEATPEQLAMRRETLEALEVAIARLPPAQRAVVLGVLRGDRTERIARHLGVAPATVRSLYRHARFQLAKSLE